MLAELIDARMALRRPASAAIAAVVGTLALAAGGCGGGETAAETVPRLSKPQLVRKLGEICQAHTDRQVIAIKAFEKKHGYPASSLGKVPARQLEQELTVVILPIVRSTIHDLGKLHPSQRQERDFKHFLKALEHGVEFSEAHPGWIATGSSEPFAAARALSWKLGTALCGQA